MSSIVGVLRRVAPARSSTPSLLRTQITTFIRQIAIFIRCLLGTPSLLRTQIRCNRRKGKRCDSLIVHSCLVAPYAGHEAEQLAQKARDVACALYALST